MTAHEHILAALGDWPLDVRPHDDPRAERIGAHLLAARAALEAQAAHLRATGIAVGRCHLHRPECAAELTVYLPTGQHATACLSHQDLAVLFDCLTPHTVPVRWKVPDGVPTQTP